MSRAEIEDALPLVLRHYERVAGRLDRATTKAAATRKASRRDILNGYLLTRSITKTARDLDVSDTLVSSGAREGGLHRAAACGPESCVDGVGAE